MKTDTPKKIDQDYALVLLVKEILSQLDELSVLRKGGARAAISHQLLGEMCSVLPELPEELQERFHEVLISISSKAEPMRDTVPSEEMIAASVGPRRRTLGAITEQLGVKAA